MEKSHNFNPSNKLTSSKRWSIPFLGIILIIFGSISIVFSIVFNSTILAFIGLGFIFWGSILQYIGQKDYVQKKIFNSSINSLSDNLNQIMNELNYKGKPIHLPPSYLKNYQITKIYVSKEKNYILPKPGKLQKQENQIFINNPEAILLTAPGLSLLNLFEEKLGKEFTEVDIEYLIEKLPQLFVEDFEIADEFRIIIKKNQLKKNSNFYEEKKYFDVIQVIFNNTVYNNLFEKEQDNQLFLSPLSSALACSFAKATGRPIIIDKIKINKNKITLQFKLLEPIQIEPSRVQEIYTTINQPISSIRRLITIESIFTFIGIIIIVWVIGLLWMDYSTWGKNLVQSLFEQRSNELISLGIDLKLIHYLLLGTGLLLSGLFTFIRKNSMDKI